MEKVTKIIVVVELGHGEDNNMPSIIDNAKSRTGQTTNQTTSSQGKSILQNALERTGAIQPQSQLQVPEMRTPQQMEAQMTTEKQLPTGAIGFNPDGSANYGSGIEGWWKGITSRIYEPVTESIGGQNVTRESTQLEQVGRAEWEGFMQLANFLSIPQQKYYEYLADRRSYEMYADIVNPNSPDIFQDNELGNFLRITSSLIPGISNLTTMYEKERIKNGNRLLPDNTFKKIQEANRIWNKENVGAGIFDTQVQSEYVKRVLNGEDPYKVRKEYSKPVENFIADYILDPLNIFDGMGIANKILGKGIKLAEGARTTVRFVDDAAEFEKAAHAAETLGNETFLKTAQKIATESANALSQNLKPGGGLFELTQSARQVVLFDKVIGVFGPMLKFAKGDGARFNDLIKAVGMMGSSNADEVVSGMKILQENKILHLFMSDNAFETARFMNKVSEKTAKLEKIADLATAGDKAKYFDEFRKIVSTVLDDMYPDIVKIADAQDEIAKIRKLDKTAELPQNLKRFENIKLSPAQSFIAKRNRAMQADWFGTKIGTKQINSFFSLIYLTSPGFTARNYMNAAVTAFIDLGPSALRELTDFTGGGYKYLEDMFGFVPGSISKAFSIVQDTEEAKGVMKYFDFMRKLAGKAEEFESVAIAANAGKRFSSEMLREKRFIESMDDLRNAGFSEDSLKFLEKKLREFNGQTDKALEAFKKSFDAGQIEHFREPEVIFSQDLLEAMGPNLVDDVRSLLKEGTLEEVMTKVDDIFRKMEDNMLSTVDDIPADHADEAAQLADGISETLNLSDDGLDQFAKKVNVRRRLEDSIIGTASGVLDDSAPVLQSIRAISTQVMNHQSKFSTAVRDIVTRLSNGQLKVQDAISLIEKDPMFAEMGQYLPKIQKNMRKETAIDMIWTYYKKHMESLWVDSAKKQYDILMDIVKGQTLSGKRLSLIEDLKLKFAVDFKYLNAEKLANGKALLNESYYFYKMGNRMESVLARARQLKLFSTEFQKGMRAQKNIPYRNTWMKVVNQELKKLGLGKIGNLNNEENYRLAMRMLDEYAVKKAKVDEIANIAKEIKSKSEGGVLTMYGEIVDEAKKALENGDDVQPIIDRFVSFVDRTWNGIEAKKHGKASLAIDSQKRLDDVAQSLKGTTLDDMLSEIDMMPILDDGNMPSMAKVLRENYAGTKRMFEAIKSGISNSYGRIENVSNMTMDQAKRLENWSRLNETKMLDFRMRAMEHMKNVRDFALLDYAGGKKNIDLALAYIFPYQFWYSRSYTNWIKRLASNPAIINRYSNFRDKLEQSNENLPEYMRNYIVFGKSIGLEKNPLMLNLEASLNPLNGLTGVDFTDKNKIVGTPGTLEYGWTKTLDSIGKFGPSPWSPINMLTGAALINRGEKEAGARWLGRLFPQSAPIKAIASLFGKNLETDPFVLLFSDGSGTDPYESRRVGRALIAMSEAGKITKEQAYEAARAKSGDVWNQAVVESTRNRAYGTISAYVLGQGFKIRSESEAQIDKFYEEYFKMWANADKFTPDEMTNYQRYIRTKYDFADLVILSGKGSKERDKAYAYSVLSRIAPGQTGDIFKALGVNPALTDLFYQSKGDMSAWNPLDKEAFMNAMVQVGTLVAIPSDTTTEQWQMVKTLYKQSDRELQTRFGEDILTKIETFYEFAYDSPEQKNYMEAHPEVGQALDYKDYLLATNKETAPYYDGLSRLERYYDGEFRRMVTEKIDPNYYEYYKLRSMIIDPNELKKFDREIGWTNLSKQYNAFKKEWDMMVFKKLDDYDKFFLQQAIPTTTQEGVSPSIGQQAIQQLLAPAAQAPKLTFQQITQRIPIPITLERALQQYVTSDRMLSSAESSMMTRFANNINAQFGVELSKDDLLSLAMDYYR